jgi:hypothetical protein
MLQQRYASGARAPRTKLRKSERQEPAHAESTRKHSSAPHFMQLTGRFAGAHVLCRSPVGWAAASRMVDANKALRLLLTSSAANARLKQRTRILASVARHAP